ncbi:FecR family protein [uncultured Croceitalea sp.]|uniref:FecR family protein n=1 Tax=uncultured Croceitalea sp. TaxID=1798908 RepID=UPI00374ED3B3
MKSEEFIELIIKYINNSITAIELDTFNSYLTNEEYDALFKSYIQANYVIGFRMNAFNTQDAKQELIEFIRTEKSVKKKKKIVFYRYAAAATILLLVSLSFILRDNASSVDAVETVVSNERIEPGTDKAILTLQNGKHIPLEKGQKFNTAYADSDGENLVYQEKDGTTTTSETAYNYLTVPRGGQFHIILSDSTEVWLNSESRLKYPVTFIKGQTREVELMYGEAYFDVSPSINNDKSKFKVLSGIQRIEVLGTEFNIKAYKDELSIYTTLVEGKILIENGLNKKILSPNEQSVINTNNGELQVTSVKVINEISWVQGEFIFERKPLKEIMKVLSRWYDMNVVFVNKESENLMFTGTLYKKQSIEEVLFLIKNTHFINNYEINNRTILLH